MKQIIWLFLFAFLFSCSSTKKAEEKSVITVSILPQKQFVERIAGDDFKVNVLIPPGASPAAYTLLPSQLKDITKSIAWFRIGHIGFEYSWKDKISQANTSMKVFDLSEGLELIEGGHDHGKLIGHGHGVDPHVWLSPKNVKKMAKKIRDILSELKPEHADRFQTGYQKFIKEIDQVDIEVRNIFRDSKENTFITFHPSFTYFAKEYGLNQVALEAGGKEPTPQHIKEVVDLAREKNIRVIYIQTEFDRDHARLFADEIDGEVIQLAPLEADWVNNIVYMAQTMRDNF